MKAFSLPFNIISELEVPNQVPPARAQIKCPPLCLSEKYFATEPIIFGKEIISCFDQLGVSYYEWCQVRGDFHFMTGRNYREKGRGERRELLMIFPIINTSGRSRPSTDCCTITLTVASNSNNVDHHPV